MYQSEGGGLTYRPFFRGRSFRISSQVRLLKTHRGVFFKTSPRASSDVGLFSAGNRKEEGKKKGSVMGSESVFGKGKTRERYIYRVLSGLWIDSW